MAGDGPHKLKFIVQLLLVRLNLEVLTFGRARHAKLVHCLSVGSAKRRSAVWSTNKGTWRRQLNCREFDVAVAVDFSRVGGCTC